MIRASLYCAGGVHAFLPGEIRRANSGELETVLVLFSYECVDADGEVHEGVIHHDTADGARGTLEEKGWKVVKLDAGQKRVKPRKRRRVTRTMPQLSEEKSSPPQVQVSLAPTQDSAPSSHWTLLAGLGVLILLVFLTLYALSSG